MNIDWGVVATFVVVVKGLWDVWSERRRPDIDLTTLDNNIAQAANVSVKSLLEAMAQLQKRVSELETSNRNMKNDLQTMGRNFGLLRQIRETQGKIIASLLTLVLSMLSRLSSLDQNTSDETNRLDQIRKEISSLGSGPL